MTKVPEYNLPKFPPMPYTKNTDKLYWRYKKKTPPKDVYKPTKLKDKHLISDVIKLDEQLRGMNNQEY